MNINVCQTPASLGRFAAKEAEAVIRAALLEKGCARIVLSTGASQFDTIQALVDSDIDFSKVEMFHLDEYVGLPDTHPASFRKYLKERFVSKVNLKAAYFVDGTEGCIEALTREIRKAPIDLGLIGIGENAHIAFNDPPADFITDEAFIIVDLNDTCKKQQVGEGWFATLDDVPKRAVTMTCMQIMRCRHIISCVPYPVKAKAVRDTLLSEAVTNEVPATLLKTHGSFSLYIDKDSAGALCPYAVHQANPDLERMTYLFG